jgi:hypothetical protein
VGDMSSEDAYNEQYAAWHLYKSAPAGTAANVSLTRTDLIRFADSALAGVSGLDTNAGRATSCSIGSSVEPGSRPIWWDNNENNLE